MTRNLLCIGHRGAMGHAPENTLASFRKALELGADCIELDVYFVGNQLLVFHDDNLERTTNGQGLLMEQSLAYLRSLDAGQGEKIPTIEEVCDLVDSKAGINIELKGPETAEPVISLVQNLIGRGWHQSQILVSSFDRKLLRTCRDLDQKVMLGVLFNGPLDDNLEFALQIHATALHPSLQFVDTPMINTAHNFNIKVLVYTVNEESDIHLMADIGVDGVFTNYPDRINKKAGIGLNTKTQNDRIPGFK